MITLGKVKAALGSMASCIEVNAFIAMLTASTAVYTVQTALGISAVEYTAILCGIIGGWLARSLIAWFDK